MAVAIYTENVFMMILTICTSACSEAVVAFKNFDSYIHLLLGMNPDLKK